MEHILTNGDYSVSIIGLHAPEYIRTDRNGTRIYHDWNCPRCAGYGRSNQWRQTGYECYECGGRGKRTKPKVVKVYTREHADKLEARRVAKVAANAPDEAELRQQEEELRRINDEIRRREWQREGFAPDGDGYLYTGKTYAVRAKIKGEGGRWQPIFNGWIAPVNLGPIEGVKVERINAADLCFPFGGLDTEKCLSRFCAE